MTLRTLAAFLLAAIVLTGSAFVARADDDPNRPIRDFSPCGNRIEPPPDPAACVDVLWRKLDRLYVREGNMQLRVDRKNFRIAVKDYRLERKNHRIADLRDRVRWLR